MIECHNSHCEHHETMYTEEPGPYCWVFNYTPECPEYIINHDSIVEME